jgi:hypothetical protein
MKGESQESLILHAEKTVKTATNPLIALVKLNGVAKKSQRR